jgi:phenylalanyl-tRNA synthetase beta chain
MRIPLSWLQEYVRDLPEPRELAERLTMAGLEVDAIETIATEQMVDHLVVAHLKATRPHPNADRLTLCTVDDGDGERQVVCGARNMKAGDAVVLARPGTVLPGGLKIKKGKLRGEESAGMLCSSTELGLPAGNDGILVLDAGIAAGSSAVSTLGLDDTILDIAVTPNRGDCLSVRGLAREIAAVCRLEAGPAWDSPPALPDGVGEIPVFNEDPAGCPTYRGLEVSGIRVGPSPAWLQRRLSSCGLRPINNVVDVTNYCLLEFGQPLHAFDRAKLAGPSIFVRSAAGGTAMEVLDGTRVELEDGDLLIADEAGPVALAGVMGGAGSAVSETTADLFLEAAIFDPARIRRTSRRLGLISDSSYRFERGIDASALPVALARAAELIVKLAGGSIASGTSSAGAGPSPRAVIDLRPARVAAILADEVATDEMVEMLESLGAAVERGKEALRVTPPSHRHDLSREIDCIEEIARLRGYDRVATELPSAAMQPACHPASVLASRVLRQQLLADGLSECVGLAFASATTNSTLPGLHPDGATSVRVRNPLRSDAEELRRSALGHLLGAQVLNRRNGRRRSDLFCVCRTFARFEEEFLETEVFAGLLSGPRRLRGPGDGDEATFWDAKGVVERAVAALAPTARLDWVPENGRPEFHPRQAARIELGGQRLGYVGLLHPDVAEDLEIVEKVALFEVDSLLVLEYAPRHAGFGAIGKFPSSSRDVSFLVPRDMLAGRVIEAIEALGEKLIDSVSVFDEYTGKGVGSEAKALAFQVVYKADDRTLTDEEVTQLHTSVVETVTGNLGLQVRA